MLDHTDSGPLGPISRAPKLGLELGVSGAPIGGGEGGSLFQLSLDLATDRAKPALKYMASPLSGVVNGPISGALLEYTHEAWGLAGWQWLFLLEGIPEVILGFVTWRFLTDRPAEGAWLKPGE